MSKKCWPSAASSSLTKPSAHGASSSARPMQTTYDGDFRGLAISGTSTKCSSRLTEAFITLWRAVDQDGEVLDLMVQSRRDKRTAKKFFRKLLKGLGDMSHSASLTLTFA